MTEQNSTPFWPRGMTPKHAALYVSLPVASFVRIATEKGLKPRRFGSRQRYDRLEIDRLFFGDPMTDPDHAADWAKLL